jgi:hypothetical protein
MAAAERRHERKQRTQRKEHDAGHHRHVITGDVKAGPEVQVVPIERDFPSGDASQNVGGKQPGSNDRLPRASLDRDRALGLG